MLIPVEGHRGPQNGFQRHRPWEFSFVGGLDDVRGEKRRPRAEWIVTRNTHPPLISDEQAELILAQMQRAAQGRRLRESPLLLSGLLRTPDGRGWHSDGGGFYRAGKGRKIAASRLEPAVLGIIASDLQSDAAAGSILEALQAAVAEPGSPRDLAALQKRIATLSTKIGRTVDLAAGLEDPAPVLRRVADLEHSRAELVKDADELRRRLAGKSEAVALTVDDVRALLRVQFQEMAQTEGRDAMRQALAAIVESVVLDPSTMAGHVNYALSAGDKVASRSRSEQSPVVQFQGGLFVIPGRRAA